jgi:hypothetical protein
VQAFPITAGWCYWEQQHYSYDNSKVFSITAIG